MEKIMLKHIKLLFQDFAAFVREDFKPAPYIYALTIIALSIIFVYATDVGYELGKGRLPTDNRLLNNVMMFSFMYFVVAVPVLILQGKYKEISKPHFYLKGLLLTTIIGISDIFRWSDYFDFQTSSPEETYFIYKWLNRASNMILVLPVLILLRVFWDKKVKGLYGLCSGNHHVKAYLWLFLCVLPILIAVAFTPAFLSYYPIGRYWEWEGLFGNAAWLNTAIFEIDYLSDFIMVELIFRGALVIGMATVIGRQAVLPMVAAYVALHFGKPVLETISAIGGGFFLGTLAYQTRHIWGGVIIHMGIAFAIELIRFLQHAVWGI